VFKFGFDCAIYQQLVQTAGDQADEFKADMSGDLLTYLSVVGEYSVNSLVTMCWLAMVDVPSGWRQLFTTSAWRLAVDLSQHLPIA
jgi:hypothetical protein